jgi:hypothetical protein
MQIKRWLGLGVAAALSACAPEQPQESTDAGVSNVANGAGEGGEGEGGEGGEGGVSAEAAASDPVVYLTALAVVEAHVRAASAALDAGERRAAGEMFAHPVSEVLLDLAPVFESLGVEPFDALLTDASVAVFDNADAISVRTRADAILAALTRAEARAPRSNLDEAAITTRVIAELVDRAALQYASAKASPEYEPYLDGYGFYLTARAWREEHASVLRGGEPAALNAIDAALVLLARAYPTAQRPQNLSVDEGTLLSASSNVKLAL